MTSAISFLASRLRDKSRAGTLEGFLTAPVLLALLVSYIPLGYAFSLVNFTYGARGLDPGFKALVPLLAAGLLLLMAGWEIFFRGLLLRTWSERYSWKKALALHHLVLNAVLLALFWTKSGRWETLGRLRFFLGENLFEGVLALFFLRTGSLLATTVLHTAYNVVRFLVLNDAAGPFETLYFYSSSSDDFYRLILAVHFLAFSLLVAANQIWGMRETGRPG